MHAKKEKIRVEIFTNLHRIEADLHVFAGARLTDIMQSRETSSSWPQGRGCCWSMARTRPRHW